MNVKQLAYDVPTLAIHSGPEIVHVPGGAGMQTGAEAATRVLDTAS